MKWRFKVKNNKKVYISQRDDEDWIEIYSKRKQKVIIKRIYKILIPKDNRDLPHCLVVAIPKKKGMISKLGI